MHRIGLMKIMHCTYRKVWLLGYLNQYLNTDTKTLPRVSSLNVQAWPQKANL